jgi:hypothetical protein
VPAEDAEGRKKLTGYMLRASGAGVASVRFWPIVLAKPLFRKAAARQFTKSILPPTALFRQCPLPDMICCSQAFCRMVAGLGAGHLGYSFLNFSLFGDFQCVVDFNTQISDCAFQFSVAKQQLDGP